MRVGYHYSCCDLIHFGHILMMKNCKAMVDILVVGILTDEAIMERKPKPTLPFKDRLDIAMAIKYADVVIPQKTYSPLPNCKMIRPEILFESESHTEADFLEGQQILGSWGGRVICLPYYPLQSSTAIKKTIKGGC